MKPAVKQVFGAGCFCNRVALVVFSLFHITGPFRKRKKKPAFYYMKDDIKLLQVSSTWILNMFVNCNNKCHELLVHLVLNHVQKRVRVWLLRKWIMKNNVEYFLFIQLKHARLVSGIMIIMSRIRCSMWIWHFAPLELIM